MNRLLLVLPVAIFLTACGGNLPQTVHVNGRVTHDGKPPPGPGTVYFLPVEAGEGFPSRPATGDYDKDGLFKATTFEPGDGLMPGKYIMHIESWASPPNMDGTPGKSIVPKKYQSALTSGFKLDIAPQMKPQDIQLDIVSQ